MNRLRRELSPPVRGVPLSKLKNNLGIALKTNVRNKLLKMPNTMHTSPDVKIIATSPEKVELVDSNNWETQPDVSSPSPGTLNIDKIVKEIRKKTFLPEDMPDGSKEREKFLLFMKTQ